MIKSSLKNQIVIAESASNIVGVFEATLPEIREKLDQKIPNPNEPRTEAENFLLGRTVKYLYNAILMEEFIKQNGLIDQLGKFQKDVNDQLDKNPNIPR